MALVLVMQGSEAKERNEAVSTIEAEAVRAPGQSTVEQVECRCGKYHEGLMC